MNQNESIDAFNIKAYTNKKLISGYTSEQGLLVAEKAIFSKILPDIRHWKILDIGVGAGRTSEYFIPLTNYYTGIDYSEGMIEFCKQKFPGANFLHKDARDLSVFEENSFDFVLFSCNGMDYINHEGRLQVLSEIHRVLKPDGYFVFSTHNRGWKNFGKLGAFGFSPNPIKFLKALKHFVEGKLRYQKSRQFEIYTDDYAIINDGAHNYRSLTYYIAPEPQIRQLASVGFNNLVMMSDPEGNPEVNASESFYVHFCLKK